MSRYGPIILLVICVGALFMLFALNFGRLESVNSAKPIRHTKIQSQTVTRMNNSRSMSVKSLKEEAEEVVSLETKARSQLVAVRFDCHNPEDLKYVFAEDRTFWLKRIDLSEPKYLFKAKLFHSLPLEMKLSPGKYILTGTALRKTTFTVSSLPTGERKVVNLFIDRLGSAVEEKAVVIIRVVTPVASTFRNFPYVLSVFECADQPATGQDKKLDVWSRLQRSCKLELEYFKDYRIELFSRLTGTKTMRFRTTKKVELIEIEHYFTDWKPVEFEDDDWEPVAATIFPGKKHRKVYKDLPGTYFDPESKLLAQGEHDKLGHWTIRNKTTKVEGRIFGKLIDEGDRFILRSITPKSIVKGTISVDGQAKNGSLSGKIVKEWRLTAKAGRFEFELYNHGRLSLVYASGYLRCETYIETGGEIVDASINLQSRRN